MQWKDQAPVFSATPVLSFHAEGRALTVEKVKPHAQDDAVYRVSVGNLFGSESVLCHTADDALATLAAILAQLERPEHKRVRPAIPETATVEPREWHLKKLKVR